MGRKVALVVQAALEDQEMWLLILSMERIQMTRLTMEQMA
jgi:hypothetical protein